MCQRRAKRQHGLRLQRTVKSSDPELRMVTGITGTRRSSEPSGISCYLLHVLQQDCLQFTVQRAVSGTATKRLPIRWAEAHTESNINALLIHRAQHVAPKQLL